MLARDFLMALVVFSLAVGEMSLAAEDGDPLRNTSRELQAHGAHLLRLADQDDGKERVCIVLTEAWSGADAAWDLVLRMENIAAVYTIDPASVSPELAKSLVEANPGLQIKRRSKAYLGVQCSALEDDSGCIVRHVVPSSPADKAGILVGSEIVRLDSREVRSPNDLIESLLGKEPGDSVVVRIRSMEERRDRDVEITLEKWTHPKARMKARVE